MIVQKNNSIKKLIDINEEILINHLAGRLYVKNNKMREKYDLWIKNTCDTLEKLYNMDERVC
jgi:hypothetical protein